MIRLEINENVHPEVAALLRNHGHDVLTVWDQSMRGASDMELVRTCRVESRALVTLDLDFADVRAYSPKEHAGIVVLRPKSQSRDDVLDAVGRLVPLLRTPGLAGQLWIVDGHQVRMRE